ncbi:MAG: chromosome partitioning protein ParA [Thalassobium sp.]|nr:MAG: chromosome partitioning protein ParA [Thalassobium sp.]
MPQQDLRQQLQQLHETLQQNPQLDDGSLELLHSIARDIDAMENSDAADIGERVQEQAIRFEQEHPTLSGILRQIVDTLGRIGV